MASTGMSVRANTDEPPLQSDRGLERVRQLADQVEEFRYKDPHLAIDYGRQALDLLQRFPDDQAKIRTLNEMGYAHMMIGEYDRALDFAGRGRDLAKATDNRKGLSRALNNLAGINHFLGDNEQAIPLFIESLHLSEQLHDRAASAGTLANLANAYLRTGRYDEALGFFQQSLTVSRAINNKQSIAYATDDMGSVYMKKGQTQRALAHFLKARDLLQELGDQQGQVANLTNLAEAYYQLQDFEQSLRTIDQGLKLSDAYQVRGDVAELLAQKARALQALRRYGDALRAARRARDAALKTGRKEKLRDAYEAMAQAFEALHKTALALDAYKKFKTANDELINSEGAKTLAHLQTQFGVERKQREIAGLKQKNRIQSLEAEQARQQRMIWFTALIGLFLLVFFVYNRRVQARRLAEERQVNQRLRDLDAVKDQVMANTSHEMRTPLNGIIGLADCMLAELDVAASEDTRRFLEMIVSSGKRLASLVNDILDFSKLKNDELELNLQPVDLLAVIEEIVFLSQPMVSNKDIDLRAEVAPEVTGVVADDNRLRQILHNLVGNAIKFTESGSIRVRGTREGEHVRIAVADTGIGITGADQERIFSAFEQLDGSIQRSYGGTGLGLAVTRELVQRHGSEIELESHPGTGSTFSFLLPASKKSAVQAAKSHAGTPRAEAAFPEHGRLSSLAEPVPSDVSAQHLATLEVPDGSFRILVVDDEPVNLEVLVRQLTIGNFELIQARDGEQALACLEQYPVDLVLLDIMMPRMSGYTVLQQIRARYSLDQLPVITVTAKNQVADLVQSFAVGANDFVSKPVTREELTARVITHLNLRELSRQKAGD